METFWFRSLISLECERYTALLKARSCSHYSDNDKQIAMGLFFCKINVDNRNGYHGNKWRCSIGNGKIAIVWTRLYGTMTLTPTVTFFFHQWCHYESLTILTATISWHCCKYCVNELLERTDIDIVSSFLRCSTESNQKTNIRVFVERAIRGYVGNDIPKYLSKQSIWMD